MSVRSRRPVLLALAVSLPVLLVVRPATAAGPTEQLRGQVDRVLKTLEDPELKKDGKVKERRAAVRKIAEEIFDFAETAKRALGRHWAGRTPAEQTEFVGLFSDLLERAYFSKIELYGGEKIAYGAEAMDRDQATVRTKIVTKQGSEIPVDYRMLKKSERWLVYDVMIEGVSLVSNYRTQFNKIIQTSSYQELVKKMKTKQSEFLEAAGKKTS
jgi:phospholipid transport system substrate-binding protein